MLIFYVVNTILLETRAELFQGPWCARTGRWGEAAGPAGELLHAPGDAQQPLHPVPYRTSSGSAERWGSYVSST